MTKSLVRAVSSWNVAVDGTVCKLCLMRRLRASGRVAPCVQVWQILVEQLEVVYVALSPANLVLDRLLNEAYAFEHIGYVVDASLLHLQLVSRHIEVDAERLARVADQVNKLAR